MANKEYEPPVEIYGEIIKKDDTKVVVSLQKYGKDLYLDLREQWKPEDQEFIPTKKGFTLSAKEPDECLQNIDALIGMLQKAKADIDQRTST